MNSQLFLIVVVIIVLLIIHRTSSNMPVQESTNSVTVPVPVPVPVRLPQLENIFKNVLSNSMPMVQEPFSVSNIKNLHAELEKLYSNGNSTTQQMKIKRLNSYKLIQLKSSVNKFIGKIDSKYNTLVSHIKNATLTMRF